MCWQNYYNMLFSIRSLERTVTFQLLKWRVGDNKGPLLSGSFSYSQYLKWSLIDLCMLRYCFSVSDLF